jgi:hypothetical protein
LLRTPVLSRGLSSELAHLDALLPVGLTGLLGAYAIVFLDQAVIGAGVSGVAFALGVTFLVPTPWRPDATFCGLIFALAASLIVAGYVNQERRLESYWPSFALWLGGLAVMAGAAYAPQTRSLRANAGAWLRTNAVEAAVVAALLAVAVVVRVIKLSSLPWPYSGDEAAHLMEALRVGEIGNMFQSSLQGHPTAYYMAFDGVLSIFGDSPFGARMFGVLLGVATVAAVYALLRTLFDQRVAFLGAAYLVGYHVALHFSRFSMNNSGDALVAAVVLLFLWRAVSYGRRADYIATGALAGLGLYLNVGCRLEVPLVLGVWLFLLPTRKSLPPHLGGAAYMAAAFFAAAGPLAYFWYEHPDEFMNRIREVGILQSGWLGEESARTGRSEISLLLDQVRLAFGAFGFYRDHIPHYNGPMPLIEYPTTAFFLLGAAVSVSKWREPRYLIIVALFVAVVVSGGVLTVDTPTAQRLLGTIPATAAFVAIGVAAVADVVRRSFSARAALATATGIVAFLVAFNLVYYFVRYAGGDYFSDGNTRIATRAGEYARRLPEGTDVVWLGAPNIYVGHPTLRYLTRGLPIYDLLDTGETEPDLVVDGPVAFLALANREEDFETIRRVCPGGFTETVREPETGATLFRVYRTMSTRECEALLRSGSLNRSR